MAQPTSDSFRYINHKFSDYCRRHIENPVAPFDLYTGFLSHAKEKERYGWMKLAKQHREKLLRTAATIQSRIYGREAVEKILRRERESYLATTAERRLARNTTMPPEEYQKEIGGKMYTYRRLGQSHLWERIGPDGQRQVLRHLPEDVE